MRALCLTAPGGPQHLELLDCPAPVLRAPDDVRIQVRSAALNRLDFWVATGAPNLPLPTTPHIVGTDAAGIVLEVGSAVTHLRPGDRVVVNPGISCGICPSCLRGESVYCRHFGVLGEHRGGTAAEELVLPGRNVLPLHGTWRWAEAAAFPLATLTAWRMLTTRAQLRAGETMLIWGIGGGVAVAALQIARELGARIAVTSSSDAKLGRARELGAELTINHAVHEDVPRLVKDHFGGGVDVVVDTVGAATWPRSLRALRPGGRLVTCGATAGPMVELDIRRLFWFQWTLLGSTMGTDAEFAQIVDHGNAGRFRPPIDAIFPLADGGEAYQRLAKSDQFGKLVLEVTS
jgi:NADPH:quinone reductase-like Zn-dependent oxidoreductase